MHYWTRGQTGQLSEHFSAKEFTCKCGMCRDQRVSQDLINKLEEVRSIYGAPITVTSGFRCARHQQNLTKQGLQTAKHSQHVEGNAADITGKDLNSLYSACEQVFKAIGIAKNFLHVDTRIDKVRRWDY